MNIHTASLFLAQNAVGDAAGKVGGAAKDGAAAAKNVLTNVLSVFDSVLGEGFGAKIAAVLTALIVFLIGKWIAKRIGKLVSKGFSKTTIDEKLASKAGMKSGGIGDMIGMMVYYLILLFVGILALDIAGMSEAVEPLKAMLNDFLGYIPNLLAGGIVAFVVVMIAKIVKGILEGPPWCRKSPTAFRTSSSVWSCSRSATSSPPSCRNWSTTC